MGRVTLSATSNYKGGRQAASTSSGGKLGRGGQYITRRKRYGDLRKSFGMSGG